MEDSITISSIRINKILAEKLDIIAKREGISRAEIIRRSLEAFLAKEVEPKVKSAQELLDLVYRRTGRKPVSVRDTNDVYNELYKEDGIT
jgi:metal-responsive CopG/Arc/MetJ family transcriptional regulator